MADNLIELEQNVETFIDPSGVAGSILAQNHQNILKDVLARVGKYVGSPYIATKEETNLLPGTMSWRGNTMNNTSLFQIDFAKLTADLNDFGLILSTLAEGDLIHFKDAKGRSVFLEYFNHNLTTGNSPVYQVNVKGKAENINYVYQDTEKLISIFQSYKQNAESKEYEIQFIAPNFVLLEDGVPKTSIDLSVAITDTIQATETSLSDFAVNSANYTFQQGDVISIVTTPDNVLELYLYKSGTKTDVNNYQKIDASKIDWSNILNKPGNITSLEVRDTNGIPQFTISDFIEFSGGVFDSANKRFTVSALLPFTVYIDPTNGSDSGGQLNNPSAPFKTDLGAFNALPTNNGQKWTFYFLGVDPVVLQTTSLNRKIKYKADTMGDFDISIFAKNVYQSLDFELPNKKIIHNGGTGTNQEVARLDTSGQNVETVTVLCDEFVSDSSQFYFELSSKKGRFICRKATVTGGSRIFNNGFVRIDEIETANTIISWNNEIDKSDVKIGTVIPSNGQNFSVAGSFIECPIASFTGSVTYNASGIRVLDVGKLSCPSGSKVSISSSIITGVSGINFLGQINNSSTSVGLKFYNFYGRLSTLNSPGSFTLAYDIKDSTILLTDTICKLGNGWGARTFKFHNTTFIQDNPGDIFTNGTTPVDVEISGFFATNGTIPSTANIIDKTPNRY